MPQPIVRVVVVTMEDAESGLPPTYRPFAVVEDDDEGPCVVCWVLTEILDDKDSRLPGNEVDWDREEGE